MVEERGVDFFNENLLRTDYRDHVCDAMLQWNGPNYFKKGTDLFAESTGLNLAKLVKTDLILPANTWSDEEYKKIRKESPDDEAACRRFTSRNDVRAVSKFLERAEEVRYRVLYSRRLWPEYVEMLREAWTTMLAEFSHSLQYVIPLANRATPFIAQSKKGKSIGSTRKHIERLNDNFSKLKARELWKKLFHSLDDAPEDSPLYVVGDVLWVGDKERHYDKEEDFTWFKKLLSEIRNPKPKKSRKSTKKKSR